MSEPRLYLASASPRRRQLLARAGIAFEPFVVPVDEEALTASYAGPLELLGEHLARHKARAAERALATANHAGGQVLAADTTVLLDDESLAKPADLAEAAAMLRRLRGREHVVATGVALAGPAPGAIVSATAATRVRMRAYGDIEITAFVATGDPLDKAGAYSIQHPDFSPVAYIAGCHLGVIGLPLCIVVALLRGESLPPACEDSFGARRDDCCPWSDRCHPPLPGMDALNAGDRLPEE